MSGISQVASARFYELQMSAAMSAAFFSPYVLHYIWISSQILGSSYHSVIITKWPTTCCQFQQNTKSLISGLGCTACTISLHLSIDGLQDFFLSVGQKNKNTSYSLSTRHFLDKKHKGSHQKVANCSHKKLNAKTSI